MGQTSLHVFPLYKHQSLQTIYLYHAIEKLVSVGGFGWVQRFQEGSETNTSVLIIQRRLTGNPGEKQLVQLQPSINEQWRDFAQIPKLRLKMQEKKS